MNDWSDGYFTSSTYTYGYYHELSPIFQKFCLEVNGFSAPDIDENTTYCELGYGQGVSVNIHAASSVGDYFGTDFNPSHAANANLLCKASNCGAKFLDDSFEQMLNRTDIPQFDFISLHGIWSWISSENQRHIVEFARKFLKPGGVFYNSYNCFPGWSPNAPLRELLILHDKFAESNSSTQKRVEDALNFADNLIKANPRYLQLVPHFASVLENIKKYDRNYLAHEYLNRDWICMYFTDVLEILGDAKLEFACSAVINDIFDAFNFNKDALNFLNTIENPTIKEQAKDYFINRQFRKDIFVRGTRRLSNVERQNRFLSTPFVLLTSEDVSTDFQTFLGSAKMNEDYLNAIVDYLRGNNCSPKTFEGFAKTHPDVSITAMIEILLILANQRTIAPCQSEDVVKKVKKQCDSLNAYLCDRAKMSGDITFLASPVIGGAIPIGRFDQMFLSLIRQGKKDVDTMAKSVWDIVSAQRLKLVDNQKTLETAEENIAKLKDMAQKFLDKQVPIFKALRII